MGPSPTSPFKEGGSAISDYTITHKAPELNLTYLNHKTTDKQYLLREMTYNDVKEFNFNLQRLKSREFVQCEHLTNLSQIDSKVEDHLCSNFYKIWSLWEYPAKNLADEINGHALLKSKFEEKQIWSILTSCIIGMSALQRKEIKHQSLTTKSILIDQKGLVKVADPLTTSMTSNYDAVYNNRNIKNVYLSPEQCDSIESQKPIINKNPYKNDVFTLGMIILQTCLLERQDECYLDDCSRIHWQRVNLNVNKVSQTYSSELRKMLEMMLANDIRQRPDWVQIEKYVNLDGNKAKDQKPTQGGNTFRSDKASTDKSQPTNQNQNKALKLNSAAQPSGATFGGYSGLSQNQGLSVIPNVGFSQTGSFGPSPVNYQRTDAHTLSNYSAVSNTFTSQHTNLPLNYGSTNPQPAVNYHSSYQSSSPMNTIFTNYANQYQPQTQTQTQTSLNLPPVSTQPYYSSYTPSSTLATGNYQPVGLLDNKPQVTSQPQPFVSSSQFNATFGSNKYQNAPALSQSNSGAANIPSFQPNTFKFQHKDPIGTQFSSNTGQVPSTYTSSFQSSETFSKKDPLNPIFTSYAHNFYNPTAVPVTFNSPNNPIPSATSSNTFELPKSSNFQIKNNFSPYPSSSNYIKQAQSITYDNSIKMHSPPLAFEYKNHQIQSNSYQNTYEMKAPLYSPQSNTKFVDKQPYQMATNSENLPKNSDEPEYVVEHFKQGSRYQGYKLHDMRHGQGSFYYQDGGKYQGSWKENKMDGFGTLSYQSGAIAYEGNWSNDQFQGKGKLYNEKPFELGDQSYDYTNFDDIEEYWVYYEGDFLEDLKDGQGKLMFSNGQYFVGTFVKDMVEGPGKFYCRNGRVISGIWEENHLTQETH